MRHHRKSNGREDWSAAWLSVHTRSSIDLSTLEDDGLEGVKLQNE
jgi:hypothetical protein